MRWLVALTVLIFTAGCNELAPENKPGGESNPYPVITLPATGSVEQPAAGETREYDVTVQFNRAAPAAGSFRIQTANGNAEAGKHFEAVDRQVQFDTDQRQATIAITILHDATQLAEQRELDFRILVVSAQNATVGDDAEQTVTITPIERDPDAMGRINMPDELVLRAPSIQREAVSYPVLITLEEPLTQSATVQLRTVESTAIEYQNFTPISTQLNVSSGAAELSFYVEILHDAQQSENLEFELLFMSASGIELGDDRSVAVTIANSNGELTAPTLSLPQFTDLYEPVTGSKDYQLVFPLSHTAVEPGSVYFRSQDGTAFAGTHFDGVNYTAAISPGANQVSLPLRLHSDSQVTGDLTFRLQILDPQNIGLPSQREFEMTIVDMDADAPPPVVPGLQYPTSVVFGRPSPSQPTSLNPVVLALSEPMPQSGSVRIQSRDGSAKSGTHYNKFDQVIQISQGATDVELVIELLNNWSQDDDPVEFDLLFSQANNIELPEIRSLTIEIQP